LNRLTRHIAAALFALAALPLAAQSQQPPPQPQNPASEVPKLVETMDVKVINVDVVVTDKKGNTIKGLTKDDFEILENGVPKAISNFYEIEPRTPPAAAATTPGATPATPTAPAKYEPIPEHMKRRIIFFIDNLSLAPFNRNRVFTDMKLFVKNVMRPGDEAMIATFNRSLKVRVPFTRDTAQLIQTFDVIAGESALGSNNTSDMRDTQGHIKEARSYDEALAAARAYSQSIEHDLRQSVTSIIGLMQTLAGVEGKKALVLASEGFPIQPGREMFEYLEELQRERSGWGTGSTFIEGMHFDASELIRSIAQAANANDITMYTVHAGGLAAGNDSGSAENAAPTSFAVSQAALSNSTESLRLLADMTGGLASVQTNNFKNAFARIERDLDAYYSLGYRAGTERVDRQRSLQVRMKNRAYIARSRQSFVEKSPVAEMNDRVIANLLYRTKANPMQILMRISTPKATEDRDLYSVPVEIQIPMEKLTLIPQGDSGFAGGFTVYVAVANKDGDMSDVQRKSHQLHVNTADMQSLGGKHYTYTLDLLMERGLNKVSVGVIDDVSNETGFARDQIIAQDLR
jgi:VWFA-related protein